MVPLIKWNVFVFFLTLKKSGRAIYWFYFFFSLSYEGGRQKVLHEDRPQWESQCYSQTFPLLDRMVSLSHQFTDITKFFFVLPVITSVLNGISHGAIPRRRRRVFCCLLGYLFLFVWWLFLAFVDAVQRIKGLFHVCYTYRKKSHTKDSLRVIQH